KDFYRSEHQKRKDEFCPFSSLADFNPLQLTKSLTFPEIIRQVPKEYEHKSIQSNLIFVSKLKCQMFLT
ncbi:hypothetical protein, partial [Streptococcus pneumoniae]|uniref:hypothetical protein n=1 Tax=Streptococcus pneumoniae TaxID=1313 RepID=UPI001E5EE89B